MCLILRRLALALLTLLATVEIFAAAGQQPAVVSGVLDLTAWNPVAQPVLSLDGPWAFGWKVFVDSASGLPAESFFHVPDFWNAKAVQNVPLTPEGYATYALKIRRTQERAVFAIHVVDMECAYALYANGVLIGGNGKPGKSAAEEIPEWKPRIFTFASDGDISLVLHVSNFHHRLGGVWKGMQFGKPEDIQGRQGRAAALELFLAGSLLMIAVYHLLIFFLRRAEKEFLLLGVLCIVIALRSFVTGERFIMTMIPGLPWHYLVRLDYLTVPVALLVAHMYLKIVFSAYYHRYVFYALAIVSVPIFAAEVFLEPRIFSHLTPLHSLMVVAWSFYLLVINIIAVLKKMPGAVILLTGWVIAIAAFINDTFYIHGTMGVGYLFAVGLYAYVLSQSYYLAMRYARAFSLSELLGKRMASLLTLTRDLNRVGQRDAALWTAADEICRVTGATGEPVVYLASDDGKNFRKFLRHTGGAMVSAEHSAALSRLTDFDRTGSAMRIPILGAGLTRGVIEVPLPAGKTETPVTDNLDYMRGILDSLALVLENIGKIEKDALAAVGEAASEIVHDINHHCQIVAHYAGTARKSGNSGEALDSIDRETAFMKNLALDILDYARDKIIVQPRIHALSEIEKTIASDLTELFRQKPIEFSLSRTAEGSLSVDLERFRRVVLNLARNAAQAMAEQGKFIVRIEPQGDVCCFVFEDNGPGIDPQVRERLFEPFASGGRGTGLGLAVVRRIVTAHGGMVRVSSESGKGCRFLVELPHAGDAA